VQRPKLLAQSDSFRGVRAVRIALLAAAFSLLAVTSAVAQPVLVLDGKKVRKANDPDLPRADLPKPSGHPPARFARVTHAQAAGPVFRVAIRDLFTAGQIDQTAYDRAKNAYNGVKRAYKSATGTRKTNLKAVLGEADDMSRRGFVTPSRLNAMSLTLERNRQWWTSGSIPRNGQRIEFSGSELVWQYYTNQGIQIQQLGNFGKANALWRDENGADLRALLDELIANASDRGGTLAFEYFFEFGGGQPPWTSGLSQATALQALARATDLTGDPKYREAGLRGLSLFEQPPPNGVRVDGEVGPHYLIYTFNPDLRVINAFLQSVIGLYDFAQLTGDPRAQNLYATAEAEARVETPRYNTGAWSLYSQSRESDLSYHKLVRDFLKRLCDRVGAPVYCDTAQAFTDQMKIAPQVAPVTRRIRGGKPAQLKFSLSKISRVGVTVLDASGKTVFATSGVTGYGTKFFTWSSPPLKGGDGYTLRVSAVDLAGNRGQTTEGPLRILKGKKPKKPRSGDDNGTTNPTEPPIDQPAKSGR
jgi:hypothetical protein